jgi:hypothetical protein
MKEKIEPFSPEMTFEDMMQHLSKMTLRDLLSERQIWLDRFDNIDKLLKAVPNI